MIYSFSGNILRFEISLKSCKYPFEIMRLQNDALIRQYSNVLMLPALLFLLNAIDVLSTSWGLSNGLVEMNPMFSFGIVPLKFLGCGVLGVTAFLQNRLNPNARAVKTVILCVVIAYMLVVANNIYYILQVL